MYRALAVIALLLPLSGAAGPALPPLPELVKLEPWRNELLAPAWSHDKYFKVNEDGKRSALGKLGCLVGSEPKTFIEMEAGAHGVASYRGRSEKCDPAGVGVIAYTDGSQWLGQVGAVESIPVPNGLGELTQPDGIRYVLYAQMDGLAWRMTRGLLAYHPEEGWYAQGEFGTGWKTDQGVYRWADGREFHGGLEGALPAGRGALMSPGGGSIEGELVRDGDGVRWRGTLVIDLPVATGFGPPGRYLVDPGDAAQFGEPVAPRRWAPTRETLAAGVANQRGCPIPPALPNGWIVWWPACAYDSASGEIRIPAYSPDMGFMLIYVVKDNQLVASELEQRSAPTAPLNVVARWEALMFDPAKGLQPLGETLRMYDPSGALMFQGTFLGLEPEGKGWCGRPAAEGGGVEACEWHSGKRIDEAFVQRARRIAQETQQRSFEEQLVQQRAAQERVAREAAERAQKEQESKSKISWLPLGGKIGALFGRKKERGDAAALVATAPPAPPALPAPVVPAAGSPTAAAGSLAALKQQALDHTCASGYRFTVQVPYRTAACLTAKLEYAKVQVCNDDNRLVAVQQACQAACGHPACIE